jgi:hypothetical protein
LADPIDLRECPVRLIDQARRHAGRLRRIGDPSICSVKVPANGKRQPPPFLRTFSS